MNKRNYIIISLFIIVAIIATYNYLKPIRIWDFLKYQPFLILWLLQFIYLYKKGYLLPAIAASIVFATMLLVEYLNFPKFSYRIVFSYLLLVTLLSSIMVLNYQLYSKLKKFKIASTINTLIFFSISLIPLLVLVYNLNYKMRLSIDALHAVFQSNINESYEYISDFIDIKWILLFVFYFVGSAILLYMQKTKNTIKINKYLIISIVVILVPIVNTNLHHLRLFEYTTKMFSVYQHELALFGDTQSKRNIGDIKYNATKSNQGETYVVVIGESLNKNHMSLYGYFRDTTPNLSKLYEDGHLLVFKNAYSIHTHTTRVMQLALTEANQYNQKKYYESLSIINILKKANIETHWLTNQEIDGINDHIVSVIAVLSNNLVPLKNMTYGKNKIKTEGYDEALINELRKVFATKTKKNRVIFVHLMGNHGSYSSRYPESYNKFKGVISQGHFGKQASKNDYLNHYDNSVLYNDFIVSSLLKELQKEKGVSGFIYMSDHADDVIGRLGHNYLKFTYQMTQIPMLAWFSDEYKTMYANKFNLLQKRENTLFSNDLFYDSLLGIIGLETDRYSALYDLTAKEYNLNAKNALVLNGKKKYTDDNDIYWQNINSKYLIETKQNSRIYPHRVNSIGKLNEIWNIGFRAFEVDVRFGDNNTTTFQVGHNDGVMGVSLEAFLSNVDYTQIQQIWLDFKNLNKNNYEKALVRLDELNKKFNLKNKMIVESSTEDEFFNLFQKQRWHISYYLPTDSILDLIKGHKSTRMEKLAAKIAVQVKKQNLSSVSFDYRLYPFVNKYLEPNISNKIVYHVWGAPRLSNPQFKDELLNNKLYLDERVKTLLSKYKSPFEL